MIVVTSKKRENKNQIKKPTQEITERERERERERQRQREREREREKGFIVYQCRRRLIKLINKM